MIEDPTSPESSPRQEPIFIRLPREWVVTCVVRPWEKTTYLVTHNGVTWTIGHVPKSKNAPEPVKMLSLFQWQVFFAVLVEYWNNKNPQNLSCRKIARSLELYASGKSIERIRASIIALSQFKVKREKDKKTQCFPLLLATIIRRKKGYHFVHNFRLHQKFIGILDKDAARLPVRFDVVRKFVSDLAAAMYLWLPSRAAAAHRSNPDSHAEISLKTLAATLGLVNAKNWRLKQFLTQGKHPVLSQLNGQPMNGGLFHISLVEAMNGGHKLILSMQSIDSLQIRPESKLLKAYLKTGKTSKSFWEALRSSPHILDATRIQKLLDIGLDEKYFSMLEQACRLLTPYAGAYDDIVQEVALQIKNPRNRIPALPLAVTMFRLALSNLPTKPHSAVSKWWYVPVHEHKQRRRAERKSALPQSMPSQKGAPRPFISQTPKSTVSDAQRDAVRLFEDRCRGLKNMSVENKCRLAEIMLPEFLEQCGWKAESTNVEGWNEDLETDHQEKVKKFVAEYQESLRPPPDKASTLYKRKGDK